MLLQGLFEVFAGKLGGAEPLFAVFLCEQFLVVRCVSTMFQEDCRLIMLVRKDRDVHMGHILLAMISAVLLPHNFSFSPLAPRVPMMMRSNSSDKQVKEHLEGLAQLRRWLA